jgi:hypothetical protein
MEHRQRGFFRKTDRRKKCGLPEKEKSSSMLGFTGRKGKDKKTQTAGQR